MQCTYTDGDTTVSITGKLTFADRTLFREMLTRLMEAKVKSTVVNLSRLEMIDSAGLGMLLIARDESTKLQRSLVLSGPAGQVKRMFDLSKFETLFAIRP